MGSTGGGQGGGGGTSCLTCTSAGKNCGTISDGCGATLDCGTCMSPSKCGWGNPAVPNVCGVGSCTPETDRAFCERLGKNCGPVIDWDNCDNSRSVASCGTCVDPQTWGGSTPNVCGLERKWRIVPFNGPGLNSVWGSARNDVWAVGTGGTIIHFNGTAWSTQPSPTTGDLWVVKGDSPTRVKIGSSDGLLERSGSGWSYNTLGAGMEWRDLALLNDEVWGVGSLSSQGAVIIRLSSAGRQAWGSPYQNAIWVNSAQEIRVFGWSVARWNGTDWVPEFSPSGTPTLSDAWGATANDAWAVGDGLFHWQGTSWVEVTKPVSRLLLSVWGSSTSDVWAVGEYGTIVHWNGSKWTWEDSPTSGTLRAVWGSSADDVWAVGDSGGNAVLLHYPY